MRTRVLAMAPVTPRLFDQYARILTRRALRAQQALLRVRLVMREKCAVARGDIKSARGACVAA